MNNDEARSFLDLARMLDNKLGEIDDAKAAIWADLLPDVPLKAAIAAMKEHYRRTDVTIMPAHIKPMMSALMIDYRGSQKRAEAEKRWARQRRELEAGTWEQPAMYDRDHAAPPPDEDPARTPGMQAAWREIRGILGPRVPRKRKWWEKPRAVQEEEKARGNEPAPIGNLLGAVRHAIQNPTEQGEQQ